MQTHRNKTVRKLTFRLLEIFVSLKSCLFILNYFFNWNFKISLAFAIIPIAIQDYVNWVYWFEEFKREFLLICRHSPFQARDTMVKKPRTFALLAFVLVVGWSPSVAGRVIKRDVNLETLELVHVVSTILNLFFRNRPKQFKFISSQFNLFWFFISGV